MFPILGATFWGPCEHAGSSHYKHILAADHPACEDFTPRVLEEEPEVPEEAEEAEEAEVPAKPEDTSLLDAFDRLWRP